jgi:hypothetical protein
MMRYLFIAARNQFDLYDYLQRQFSGDETVQVLLDRRCEERRHHQGSEKALRRRGERRYALSRESELATHGFVIVRRPGGLPWHPPWWRAETPGTSGELDRHQDAKRVARLIVGAIVLYHKDKIAEALKNDTLFDVLANELEEGRRCYERNVDPSVGAGVDYFAQAIVDILVKEQGNVESRIW